MCGGESVPGWAGARGRAPAGSGWPLFSSCLCSCWRNRGGTSRGGYRGPAGCCCGTLLGGRLPLLVTVGTVGVAGWGGLGLGLADSGTAGTNRKCVNDDDTEHAHEHLAKASENAQTSFPWFQAKVSTVMTAV